MRCSATGNCMMAELRRDHPPGTLTSKKMRDIPSCQKHERNVSNITAVFTRRQIIYPKQFQAKFGSIGVKLRL